MVEASPKAYFRDKLVDFDEAQLSIASAPVLYGLSIYTVFRVIWNQEERTAYLFRLPDHFKRLQNSAKIMAFDDFLNRWNYHKFEKTIRELLVANKVRQDSLVRVSVFVDDKLKGTRMHGLKHELSAFVYPATPLLPSGGAHLCVSSWRRMPDNAIPARAKVNGSYVNASLMKHEAVLNGYDDAIALDEAGHVSESSVANIFLVRGSLLITPAGSNELLEGVTRDTILRLADHLGVRHEQRAVDRSEMYIADEVFVCGSSVGITPVLSIDRRPVGTGEAGKITRRLVEAYQACDRGRVPEFRRWLTPIN